MFFFALIIKLIQLSFIQTYTFNSSINNLLYVRNTSTLYAISSSYLHQLYWSTTNQTLLLLHRRVQLHSTLDNTEYGVSVFLYEQSRHLLIICSRSLIGRCILYDANDISRIYILNSTIETNYLGCLSGCYTFLSSSSIIRSALTGNRREKNGNIINSIIDFQNDLNIFNIKYQFQSSDHTLITSLTFLSDNFLNIEYIYGFDYQEYTYYLLKSSRLARLCQSSIVMQITYEEILLISCEQNLTIITNAYHSFEKLNYLYIIYDNILCVYTMNDILQAFQQSKFQCQAGNGTRLGFIIDNEDISPKCEKIDEENFEEIHQCIWQSNRKNTYMNGTIGAIGKKLYQSNVKIIFIFAHDNIIIIGTNQRHVIKFIRSNQTILHFIHKTIYYNQPFNIQYVIDQEYQSLIFAIGTELHRYAYNSCSLYDTCQSCIGSRHYDTRPCIWFNSKCLLSSNSFINDRSCPPIIDQIQPMNASVNREQILLTIKGTFEGVKKDFVKIFIQFSIANQSKVFCTIKMIQNNSLTCHLILPKQADEGIILINIQPEKILYPGDTDISGSFEYPEKFQVYIPKPILVPNYGPAIGGTKIRIQNLDFNLNSTIKIYLGKNQCHISKYDYLTNEIQCINQACINDIERLELNIYVNNYLWQIERTFFQCRVNPIVLDWYPKKAIISGGIKLFVLGENFDVIQNPMMKSIYYNSSNLEFLSLCEVISTSQMICLSPIIDKKFQLIPLFHLEISFIMDNMKIIPVENILTIINNPIYYSFQDSIQLINSTNIIQFEGLNLTNSDQINIRIDNINNACIPFNLTDIYLSCLISKSIMMKNLTNSELFVEILIGTNLTFHIGKIQFENQSQSSSLIVPYLTRQFSLWTIIILIIVSSITILILLFSVIIITRRRYYYVFKKFQKETKPPEYYQRIWSELGKTRQINRKNIFLYEKIGHGCFGDVYRGELKQNNQKSFEVAIKIVREQNLSSINEFLYEANRMKDFSHRNILSLIGVSWDSIYKAMVLLPYMKNGDLKSYISNENNRPTVRQLIQWSIQIADGMEYLSSLKFVHRDLATRNCMLDEEFICRISDFGLSRDVIDRDYYVLPITTKKENDGNNIQMIPRRLPIRWLSPESIESSKYTIQSDVWSFGVLLWELMSRGKTPYPGIDNADIYTYIKNGYRLQQPTYCPTLLYKSVMILCWHVDPIQRPTFTQLAHDIRHILHQLELEQKRKQSSSADDDDTTIIQRYPIDRKIKSLSTTSLSSTSSIDEQYITTPHRQSENEQLLFDRREDNEDAYAIEINATAEIFSTTRLLPEYTETIITEEV